MIKHEIRWEYILVICIILGTLPCNAQSVISMPKDHNGAGEEKT